MKPIVIKGLEKYAGMTQQQIHEMDIARTYGKCALCDQPFKYGDSLIVVTPAGCGQSQGMPELYEETTKAKRYHLTCSDGEAVKAQAARIRDLVSENVKLSRQVEALNAEKVQHVWGTLNAVRMALRFTSSDKRTMDDLKGLLPRIEEVLDAMDESKLAAKREG